MRRWLEQITCSELVVSGVVLAVTVLVMLGCVQWSGATYSWAGEGQTRKCRHTGELVIFRSFDYNQQRRKLRVLATVDDELPGYGGDGT